MSSRSTRSVAVQFWSYHAQAGIRTAVSVGPYKTGTTNGLRLYFSDGAANRVRGRCEYRPRTVAAKA
jgi:hypothetical protein